MSCSEKNRQVIRWQKTRWKLPWQAVNDNWRECTYGTPFMKTYGREFFNETNSIRVRMLATQRININIHVMYHGQKHYWQPGRKKFQQFFAFNSTPTRSHQAHTHTLRLSGIVPARAATLHGQSNK
jgi:hypothetical protein